MAKRARIPHFDNAISVGQRLYDARNAANLSQRDLAFPGCSAAYISRIERGERTPSLQVLRELARRTGVSEIRLAYGQDGIDRGVADRLRDVEEALRSGNAMAVVAAYQSLAKAATKAARSAAAIH